MKNLSWYNILFIVYLILTCSSVIAQQKPTWIWYPGDWEIWLSNQLQTKRVERDFIVPPFWRMDTAFPLVSFHKTAELDQDEIIKLHVEGSYNVTLNGQYVTGSLSSIQLTKGKNDIKILVYNPSAPPAIFVSGKSVISDNSWTVSAQNQQVEHADSWIFDQPEQKPSNFTLAQKRQSAVSSTIIQNGLLVDFGKETFGFLSLHDLKGHGNLPIFYGESKEEALDTAHTETLDRFNIQQDLAKDFQTPVSRAFRYVFIPTDRNINFKDISMIYEYLPVQYKGDFESSDKLLNQIWQTAAYTLHLSTREFFLDGIKRDRWLWSGDAYQSYLMNYYLFFDQASVKRTTRALRGKDPVTAHINTILDYSFYWFMGIYDYYYYTGDLNFIKQLYPKMSSLMDFCLNRRNAEGLVEGQAGDWVFLDWAPMSKEGELSAEQILFCRSLETMALCAELLGEDKKASYYQELANHLKIKIKDIFWDDKKGVLLHNRVGGIVNNQVTKYANMFGLLYGYLDYEQSQKVKTSVILNPAIQKITTPYMRFYELEALCSIGEYQTVLDEIRNYWGGMLNLGATSFWETYDPTQRGSEHLAMYGRRYGKSLCHAWGASPIYLVGKYFLGVTPLSPGFEKYLVQPALADLKWMSGRVPTANGEVGLFVDHTTIRISSSNKGKGILRFRSVNKPISDKGTIIQRERHVYELELLPKQSYVIHYKR